MNNLEGFPAADVFTEVTRCDGEQKTIRVVKGHLLVCKGCCCGNTEKNMPAVPIDTFKREWKERGIRRFIHLTISGCLGPCAVPNVVLLTFEGSTIWFHSINSENDVTEIYNYIDTLLNSGAFSLPTGALAGKIFQRYSTDAVCSQSGGDLGTED